MDHNNFLKCKPYITEVIFARYDEIKKIKPIFTSTFDVDLDEETRVDDEEVALYSWKLLKLLMHMADISNSAKRKNVSIQWTNCVLKEFFLQGDCEKELGLPVSPLCNCASTNHADSQMGFIGYRSLHYRNTFHSKIISFYKISKRIMTIGRMRSQKHFNWGKKQKLMRVMN